MSHRGVELLLDGGRITISSNSITFPPEFNYGQNEEFLRLFVLSYVKFLCDSPLELLSKRPISSYTKFFRRLCSEPIGPLIKKFSGYFNSILENEYSTGADSSTRVFHEFMKDTPVFKEYLTWIRTGRPELLKYVLSFLTFGKKLEYIDPEFDSTAFRGWIEVEERLRTLDFHPNDITSLANIIKAILPPLSPDNLLPRFGPGKVSERGVSNVYDKLSSLSYDRRLEYVFLKERPSAPLEKGFGLLKSIAQGSNSSDISRLKFVPKDISKSRSICMEPNGYMYFQQEVLRWMRSAMASGLISKFVDMDDQTGNQMAAMHGSTYLCSDTIDLSSASDSVHVDLVKGVFPRTWLFYMLGTRTSRVLDPEGQVRTVMKFAPMGSAICFPTQCIIFAAVCLYCYTAARLGKTTGSFVCTEEDVLDTIHNHLTQRRSALTPFNRKYEPPIVYGDDIIVDTRITDSVTSTLSRLGFSVNRSKSFTGSQSFRESCGVFAFEGQDVTPVTFRLPFLRKGKWDSKIYASIIGGINKMNSNGYHSIASFWLSWLKAYRYKYPIAFTEDPLGFGIFTRNKHRVEYEHLGYIDDYQCFFEVQQGIGPKHINTKEPKNLEDYMYIQWWRSRVVGVATPLSERGLTIRPQETRLAPIWARCEQ